MVCCSKTNIQQAFFGLTILDILHRRRALRCWRCINQSRLPPVLSQTFPFKEPSLGCHSFTGGDIHPGNHIHLSVHLPMQPNILRLDAMGRYGTGQMSQLRHWCRTTRHYQHTARSTDLRATNMAALELESFQEEETSGGFHVLCGVFVRANLPMFALQTY